MTRRLVLPVLACALLATGCGGSSAPSAARVESTPTSGTPATAASASAPAPGGSAAAGTSGAAPVGSTGTTTRPGAATSGSTGATTNNGSTAPAFTAPGTYTYDTSGTVTAGTSRDASGTATLTVDPPAGGRQHSLLGTDQGRTDEDVIVRSGGRYLVRLAITNPAFSKEFRPSPPGLLVPEPAAVGRSWSWTATSTDGKTTASVTARITGRQTLTIGGAATPTTVIESTLKLTGDITYTAHMQSWADLAHRLSVKDHTKGEGMVGGVQFTTDITNVIRSTTPS